MFLADRWLSMWKKTYVRIPFLLFVFLQICGALRDLVPFVKFKKREKHLLKPATLLKLTLLHGCFSRFLNCANGTKSCNALHVTNLFQPLDITVNRSFKALMKGKFTEWCSRQIAGELKEDDIEIKLRLSVLKTLHVKWLTDTFNFMTSQARSEVISKGWKEAGITEVLSKGLSGLESLDPFESVDPFVELINSNSWSVRSRNQR